MIETKRAHLRDRLQFSGGFVLVKINFNDKNHKMSTFFQRFWKEESMV